MSNKATLKRFLFGLLAAAALILLGTHAPWAQNEIEYVNTPEQFKELKLRTNRSEWSVKFICFDKCDSRFNERLLTEVKKQTKSHNAEAGPATLLYVVIYSGDVDHGDIMIRLDNAQLDAITKPLNPKRYVFVNLLFSVNSSLPCDSVTYGLDGAGTVNFVIVDYVSHTDSAVTEEMVRNCTNASLRAFEP
jgi:hypothetical protein